MGRSKEEYIALLEETAAYYSEDVTRRGDGKKKGCVYCTEDGRQCAVGRCLINAADFQERTQKPIYSSTSIDYLFKEGAFNDVELKEEYRGFHVKFWEQLQGLHDGRCNWDENGITKEGKERYDLILNIIELNYLNWSNEN